MIKKLRRKFIILSSLSLLALLLLIVIGMNIINYYSFLNESDELLDMLSHNGGEFPFMDFGKDGRLPPHMSPETPYETRYFSVLVTRDGRAVIDIRHTVSVTEAEAREFVEYAYTSSSDRGFAEQFRYLRIVNGDGMRITFLDCGRKLDALYGFALSGALMALIGYILIFAFIVIMSKKIVRPVAESYSKQRRFITDAGHEIKTPLTIINANADLAEMDGVDSEYITEIKRQTKRLGELTGSLVYLSKMEEERSSLLMTDFSLSDAVADTASSFRQPYRLSGKELMWHIEPLLTLCGNESAVRQLVSILLDNALKYSTEGSRTELFCARQGRSLCFSVSNPTAMSMTEEDTERIFDRFYRADPSRNSRTGGHGIGLSVAKAIVDSHGGRVRAQYKDGIFTVTVCFAV